MGRNGVAVSVLARPDQAEQLRDIWWAASSSIGLRERSQGRWLLPRRGGIVSTPWGALRAKQVKRPDGRLTVKPEADELQRLSRDNDCPLIEIRSIVATAVFEPSEPWSW